MHAPTHSRGTAAPSSRSRAHAASSSARLTTKQCAAGRLGRGGQAAEAQRVRLNLSQGTVTSCAATAVRCARSQSRVAAPCSSQEMAAPIWTPNLPICHTPCVPRSHRMDLQAPTIPLCACGTPKRSRHSAHSPAISRCVMYLLSLCLLSLCIYRCAEGGGGMAACVSSAAPPSPLSNTLSNTLPNTLPNNPPRRCTAFASTPSVSTLAQPIRRSASGRSPLSSASGKRKNSLTTHDS